MLTLLIICFIAGGIGAMLQGMLGIGTGVITVPLLTFILPHYGISPNLSVHIAIATSMAAIAINSVSALISHHKRHNIQWHLAKRMIIFSVIGSGLGALVASHIAGAYLRDIFGVFLVFTAAYMLLKRQPLDLGETIPNPSLLKLAPGAASIGFIASMVGSGGGIFMVPFLNTLKLKMRYAVGTATLLAFPVSVVGAVTYIWAGLFSMPATSHVIGYVHWPVLIMLALAGMIGAPLGIKLASKIHTRWLQRGFAILILLIGIKMIL